jgi:WD40 repeat protein
MLSSNRIVTSSSDFSMKILNLTTGFCLKTFSSPVSDGFVRQIEAWNNELVTCSQSYIIKWNIEENKNEKIIREGSLCIKVIENNQLLSCDDRSIKVWDLVSGECLKLILVNHQIDCFQVLLDGTIVSPDRVISSGKTVKTLKRWHLASKDPLQTLPDTHGLGIHCMNALENNRMATGSFDKKIKIWDLNAEKCVLTLEGHSSFVNSLVMISNEIIASCSSDKTIRLWNLIDGTCIKTIEGHTESIGCIQAI